MKITLLIICGVIQSVFSGYHFLKPGSWRYRGSKPQECRKDTAKTASKGNDITVQCCTETNGVLSAYRKKSNGECFRRGVDYNEAKSICEGSDGRLCTENDVENQDIGEGTGCVDDAHIWIAGECGPPVTWDATKTKPAEVSTEYFHDCGLGFSVKGLKFFSNHPYVLKQLECVEVNEAFISPDTINYQCVNKPIAAFPVGNPEDGHSVMMVNCDDAYYARGIHEDAYGDVRKWKSLVCCPFRAGYKRTGFFSSHVDWSVCARDGGSCPEIPEHQFLHSFVFQDKLAVDKVTFYANSVKYFDFVPADSSSSSGGGGITNILHIGVVFIVLMSIWIFVMLRKTSVFKRRMVYSKVMEISDETDDEEVEINRQNI